MSEGGTRKLTPDQAVSALIERLAPVDAEEVSWQQAAGRILAASIVCDRDSPPCDVSAMDGYAVRLADASRGGAIEVAGEVLPGRPPLELPPGKALRIVTGAPVPGAADTVVRREDVASEQPSSIVLASGAAPAVGDNIRRQGENAKIGSEALAGGRRITPAAMSALAAMGVTRPRVYRRVRLGILVTGSEVHSVESTPRPWELRDSNGPQLMALAAACPWIELVQCAHVIDVELQLQAKLGELLEQCDAVLLTGGVSMGSHDFVPAAVRYHGATVLFHRLPIRPGKPVLGAVSRTGQPIVALPGNPVSVLVTACRFAGPALRRIAGMESPAVARGVSRIEAPVKPLDLWRYLPVVDIGSGLVRLVPNQGSGDLVGVARSDGFVEVAPDCGSDGPFPLFRWEW